ncbi:MAG: signal peptidase I [Microbacter sp.]
MTKLTGKEPLIHLAEALLEGDHSVSFVMQGYSMYPTLRPSDKGLVEKCHPKDLRKGDILVFRQDQQWIAHRLMQIKVTENGTTFLTKGDRLKTFDAPVDEKAVVGKVIAYERHNKTVSLNGLVLRKQFVLHFPTFSARLFSMELSILLQFLHTRESIARLIKHVKLFLQGSVRIFLINSLISVLQGVVPLLTIVSIKMLIDQIGKASLQGSSVYVLFWLIITGSLFLLAGILTEMSGFFLEKMEQSVSRMVYRSMHDKHATIPLAAYEIPTEQDKMHRAVQEASFRPLKWLNELLGLIRSVTGSLLLAVIFLTIRWYLPIILLVAVLPGVVVRLRYARRNYRLKTAQSTQERALYYFNRVLTAFPFAKELRLFHFSDYFKTKFSTVQEDLFAEKLSLRKAEMTGGILTQLFAVMVIFGSMGLFSYLSLNNSVSVGTVVLFFFAFQRGYAVVNELFQSIIRISQDNIFLDDVSAFLQQSQDVENKQHDRVFSLKKEIRFEQASFSYAHSGRQALKNIDLIIPVGKKVAFVGENGSGKTTTVKLLCGFYYPDSGKVTYDGISTTEFNPSAILEHIAAVFQDFALYNLTALENIGLGNVASPVNLEKTQLAAQKAGIHDVLNKLPRGYHHLLGNLFEGGEELSMGQWQKMALARAFYRDSELIVLDEPSSALDAHAEKQMVNALRRLTADKTAVIVSHRLSTVQWADKIYFFHDGEVREEGTHTELMALKGGYYQLFNAVNSGNDGHE